jgi:anti-anti-sigma factor
VSAQGHYPGQEKVAMKTPQKFLAVERNGSVFCVRLLQTRIEDHQMEELGAEVTRLIDEENARKIVFNLGPDDPDCLISVFLAKLINLQRRLNALGGTLALAHLSPDTREIFRIAGIEKFFRFYPDQQAALQALEKAD